MLCTRAGDRLTYRGEFPNFVLYTRTIVRTSVGRVMRYSGTVCVSVMRFHGKISINQLHNASCVLIRFSVCIYLFQIVFMDSYIVFWEVIHKPQYSWSCCDAVIFYITLYMNELHIQFVDSSLISSSLPLIYTCFNMLQGSTTWVYETWIHVYIYLFIHTTYKHTNEHIEVGEKK